jgi:hypothetical protein
LACFTIKISYFCGVFEHIDEVCSALIEMITNIFRASQKLFVHILIISHEAVKILTLLLDTIIIDQINNK